MKKLLLVLAGIATAMILVRAAPPVPVTVTFLWSVPTNDSTWPTNYTWRIYGTTNLLAPTNTWPLVATVTNPGVVSNGTLLAYPMSLLPAQYFFTMTASNLWGESPFSNAALTPAPASVLNNLQISR